MSFHDFTKMHVWQLAFDLLLKVYNATKHFPPEEKFGMIADIHRSANSITHNIAEGYGRFEPKDKTRFYKISRGSSYELISQCLASYALHFIKDEKLNNELIDTGKKIIEELDSLIKSIENNS